MHRPGLDGPEGHVEGGPGVDQPRQRRRQVGDHPGDGVDQVAGQVGAGGVPAGPGQVDLDQVGGGGDGPDPDAEPADLQLGVAVEGVDGADPFQHPVGDDVDGAAGQALLGRLEDQPHPAGQAVGELGQGQAGAEQDGGVHVVAAGVADPRHRGAVGHVLLVLQGQRVQVGPQGHRRPVAGADVADQPGAGGQQAGPQAHGLQAAGDQGGGLAFGHPELGVGVEVTPEVDQLGVVGGQER